MHISKKDVYIYLTLNVNVFIGDCKSTATWLFSDEILSTEGSAEFRGSVDEASVDGRAGMALQRITDEPECAVPHRTEGAHVANGRAPLRPASPMVGVVGCVLP